MPAVYSLCKCAQVPVPAGAVYIGRPSKWGNPFMIGRDGSRDEVVELFRDWVLSDACDSLRADARSELAGKDLACWCAPKPCHGDVLLEIANG